MEAAHVKGGWAGGAQCLLFFRWATLSVSVDIVFAVIFCRPAMSLLLVI